MQINFGTKLTHHIPTMHACKQLGILHGACVMPVFIYLSVEQLNYLNANTTYKYIHVQTTACLTCTVTIEHITIKYIYISKEQEP